MQPQTTRPHVDPDADTLALFLPVGIVENLDWCVIPQTPLNILAVRWMIAAATFYYPPEDDE